MTGVSTTQQFVDRFDGTRGRLPGQNHDWMTTLRQDGIDRFSNLGIPTPRLETWKYTKLTPFEDTHFEPSSVQDGDVSFDDVASLCGGCRLVFANGFLRPELSDLDDLPEGVIVESFAQTLERDPSWLEGYLSRPAGEALFALNTAMMENGYVVHVARGVVVENPIEVVFFGGFSERALAHHPRNLIILEEGSQATLVKRNTGFGIGPYLSNGVTDIEVGDGAKLYHYKVQAETRDAIHVNQVRVNIGKDATYEYFGLSMGGRLSRTEITAELNGENANCRLNGAYMMRGSEHCDYTTVINHNVPDTTSSEVFKGVLDDDARGVFQGKIVVHKGAQRTDGYQISKALLLSNNAEMDAKPELEIYADDVKCSHGATTGQIDETALFYLRSRGIPEAQARNLLIQSFLGEALNEITMTAVHDVLLELALEWLPAHCYRAGEWTSDDLEASDA